MSLVESIKNLYREDSRFGDACLRPQRWCGREWKHLFSQLGTGQGFGKILQVYEAIALAVPLIFASLAAMLLGVVAITLKSFIALPNDPDPNQRVVQGVVNRGKIVKAKTNPSFLRKMEESENDMDKAGEVPATLQMNEDGCAFEVDRVTMDIFCYIAGFLKKRECFKLTMVCKEFHVAVQNPVIWSHCLEICRIWGATKWSFKHIKNQGYAYAAENEFPTKNNPLDQLKIYSALERKGIFSDSILDSLARLMPGGPIAFAQVFSCDRISPKEAIDHMTGSIVVGIDEQKNGFIALKVIDTSHDDRKEEVVLFSYSAEKSRQWRIQKSAFWTEGELSLMEQKDFGYLLALLSGELEARQDFPEEKYKKTIKLVA